VCISVLDSCDRTMSDLVQVFQAAACVFVIAALAMPAGVGGGLLYVPLLLLVGVTSSANASAALSQPIVVGGALAANLFNFLWHLRHPGRRLVEPSLAVASIAPCLAGVTLGALLNRTLPEVGILALLVATIVWNLLNSIRKAVALWRRESLEKAAAAQPAPTAIGAETTCGRCPDHAQLKAEQDAPDSPYSTYSVYAAEREEGAIRQRRPSSCDEETQVEFSTPGDVAATTCTPSSAGEPVSHSSKAPPMDAPPAGVREWLKLGGIWLFMLFMTVLRGGQGVSLFSTCSWQYWSVTVGSTVVLLLVGWRFRHPGISMPKCFGVGVLCAIVGIGGGLVLNPMLLSLGVDAMRSTATVTVMMLMICTSATLTFAMAGSIPMVPVAILSTASFLGSFAGKTLVGWVVSRTGRTSILVFLLASFLTISGLVVVGRGVKNSADAITSGRGSTLIQVHDLCASS